jgi:hypothetical protein
MVVVAVTVPPAPVAMSLNATRSRAPDFSALNAPLGSLTVSVTRLPALAERLTRASRKTFCPGATAGAAGLTPAPT